MAAMALLANPVLGVDMLGDNVVGEILGVALGVYVGDVVGEVVVGKDVGKFVGTCVGTGVGETVVSVVVEVVVIVVVENWQWRNGLSGFKNALNASFRASTAASHPMQGAAADAGVC